jgi:hypothetical protein
VELTRQRLVLEDAPAAARLLAEVVRNPDHPIKVRVDAAKTIMDRAGFVAPKASESRDLFSKALSEMTSDELKDAHERASEAKDVIASALADRAKPVIDSTPSEVQVPDILM